MDVKSAGQLICEIGRRAYERGLVVAGEGNLSIRLDTNAILCTPSGRCKGFLDPDELCVVDLEGTLLEGKGKPSSELRLHLEVYNRRDDVDSAVHCHPPHATAFAITGEAIPCCVTPEVELFLGEVPTAPYGTPGTPELSDSIIPFVDRTNVIVLSNHGTLSYDVGLERAFWWTEILENYCRTLLLARQLGPLQYLTEEQARSVLRQKRSSWGIDDPRMAAEYAKQPLSQHPLFRSTWKEAGVGRRMFPPPDSD